MSSLAIPDINVLLFEGFEGGLNLKSSQQQLAPNESPDMLNVRLDERGGVRKRLGFTADGAMAAFASNVTNAIAWDSTIVVLDGPRLKKRTAPGTFTTMKAFSNSDRVALAIHDGDLLALHPVDRLFLVPAGSTTPGARLGTHVGTTLAVWKTKVYIGDGNTLRWSGNDDPATWPAGSFNKIIEAGEAPIVDLHVGERGSLLVFKENALHYVYDDITGAYQTISTRYGTASDLSVETLDGRTYSFCKHGIVQTDGLNEPIVLSEKVEPLFHTAQMDHTMLDNVCAGIFEDKVLFSYETIGATANDRTLELDPLTNSIVVHSIPAAAWAFDLDNERKTWHVGAGASYRKLYESFSGGADDGAAIDSRFTTAWITLNALLDANVRRMIAFGSGDPRCFIRSDYEDGDGLELPIDWSSSNPKWTAAGGGGPQWGDGTDWASALIENIDQVWELGIHRAISFRFRESSSNTLTLPALNVDGEVETAGAWALYGMRVETIPLGLG